jgi:hypothetical protein
MRVREALGTMAEVSVEEQDPFVGGESRASLAWLSEPDGGLAHFGIRGI